MSAVVGFVLRWVQWVFVCLVSKKIHMNQVENVVPWVSNLHWKFDSDCMVWMYFQKSQGHYYRLRPTLLSPDVTNMIRINIQIENITHVMLVYLCVCKHESPKFFFCVTKLSMTTFYNLNFDGPTFLHVWSDVDYVVVVSRHFFGYLLWVNNYIQYRVQFNN